MEQIKFPVKALCSIAVVSTLLISACNNNDTSKSETNTVSTTDTSAPMMVDTTNQVNMMDTGATKMGPINMDTSIANANKTTAKTGMAKPDPSKKGKKGKALITETPSSKMKTDATPDASGAYRNVDYIPSFPGGYKGLQKYFDDNLEYPTDAQDQGVEGIVRIGFTVDEKGKLMNPMVEGNNEGYGLDEEALRVVSKMPTWVPGKINGKPVKTKFTLPVKFVLN
jgi:periplasmic protein TonB